MGYYSKKGYHFVESYGTYNPLTMQNDEKELMKPTRCYTWLNVIWFGLVWFKEFDHHPTTIILVYSFSLFSSFLLTLSIQLIWRVLVFLW